AACRAVSYWIPAGQRTGINGMVNGAALVGIAATYGVFGALLDWFNWPTAFLITGTFTALLALLWAAYARDRPWEHAGVNRGEVEWICFGEAGDSPGTRAQADAEISSAVMRLRNPPERTGIKGADPEAIRAGDPGDWPETKAKGKSESSWLALLRNRSLVLLT